MKRNKRKYQSGSFFFIWTMYGLLLTTENCYRTLNLQWPCKDVFTYTTAHFKTVRQVFCFVFIAVFVILYCTYAEYSHYFIMYSPNIPNSFKAFLEICHWQIRPQHVLPLVLNEANSITLLICCHLLKRQSSCSTPIFLRRVALSMFVFGFAWLKRINMFEVIFAIGFHLSHHLPWETLKTLVLFVLEDQPSYYWFISNTNGFSFCKANHQISCEIWVSVTQ